MQEFSGAGWSNQSDSSQRCAAIWAQASKAVAALRASRCFVRPHTNNLQTRDTEPAQTNASPRPTPWFLQYGRPGRLAYFVTQSFNRLIKEIYCHDLDIVCVSKVAEALM